MSPPPARAAHESCPSWCVLRHGVPAAGPVVHIGGALLVRHTVLRLCTTIDTGAGTEDGPYVLVGEAEYTLHEAEALLAALTQVVDQAQVTRRAADEKRSPGP